MAQDATKVVLAGSLSSVKEVENLPVDPADFPAGLVAWLASTGLPVLDSTVGMIFGVSRGRSLSDIKQTSFQRTGLRVPVRAALKRSTGIITITNIANLINTTGDKITVGVTEFVAQAGAVSEGEAKFQAATGTTETAASLAAQINAHAVAGLLVYAVAAGAVVTLYAKVEGAGTGNDVALSYTDTHSEIGATVTGLSGGKLTGGTNTVSSIAYAVKGAKMYVNKLTGQADIALAGFTTITDAMYSDLGPKTGIAEDGTEVGAVVVDMPGGL